MDTSGSKVKCNTCGDIIQSMYRHDFKRCKCKALAVDGGNEYLKVSCASREDFEIVSEEQHKSNANFIGGN